MPYGPVRWYYGAKSWWSVHYGTVQYITVWYGTEVCLDLDKRRNYFRCDDSYACETMPSLPGYRVTRVGTFFGIEMRVPSLAPSFPKPKCYLTENYPPRCFVRDETIFDVMTRMRARHARAHPVPSNVSNFLKTTCHRNSLLAPRLFLN